MYGRPVGNNEEISIDLLIRAAHHPKMKQKMRRQRQQDQPVSTNLEEALEVEDLEEDEKVKDCEENQRY